MPRNRNPLEELLEAIESGVMCPHELQLQRVSALLVVLALRQGGRVTVPVEELKALADSAMSIQPTEDGLEIVILRAPPRSEDETAQPTHAAPSTRQ